MKIFAMVFMVFSSILLDFWYLILTKISSFIGRSYFILWKAIKNAQTASRFSLECNFFFLLRNILDPSSILTEAKLQSINNFLDEVEKKESPPLSQLNHGVAEKQQLEAEHAATEVQKLL